MEFSGCLIDHSALSFIVPRHELSHHQPGSSLMGTCSSTILPHTITNTQGEADSHTAVQVSSSQLELSNKSESPQYSEDESHKEGGDSDWSSEEELFTNYSDEAHNIVHVETNREASEDGDDLKEEEEEEMFWIPATLASHMGVRSRSVYPVIENNKQRDRIYADDADLFMSVETTKRSSSYLLTGDLVNKPKSVELSVENSFVNNNSLDLVSLGRN